MPSIFCYGYLKGSSENVSKNGYQIATVQSSSKARHRVVALPRSDRKLGEEGPEKEEEPVTVEVDGVIDLSSDSTLKDDKIAPVVSQISERLQQRHSSTIIAHGLVSSGKTEVISRLVPAILSSARRHIDTSGREARERREQVRQLQQQKLMQEKKETELRDSEHMQVIRLRHQSEVSLSSIGSPRGSLKGPKRESILSRNRKSSKPLMDEVHQRMKSLGKRGFIHTPAPPPVPVTTQKAPHPPAQRKSVVFNSKANEAFDSLDDPPTPGSQSQKKKPPFEGLFFY